ncbi:hypothetical protein [uncultured Thiocystis sp.]|jgi:hypothetical protein|uniref:hypothetical protein n=1 Tax=uncultured Thiocystis sp. TaxID=1202134 RepID=UPI0025D3FA0D|nr:hypothetical protein [uncultured Thiocystis sp.]
MDKLVAIMRALANRYPRLAWLLADIIRRFPSLNDHLAHRYSIFIPARPPAGDILAGYRFPLSTTTERLTGRGRAILGELELTGKT